MIDSIIESLPHAPGCACHTTIQHPGMPLHHNCNCPRREQVAFLERLRKPTPEMRKKLMDWLLDTDNIRQNDDGWGITIETIIVPDFAARSLKAAEEGRDE